MARPLRNDPDGGVHHVMNRGVDRRAVFLDDSGRVEFGSRLADIHDRFGIEIYAYCLMTTHYHLLAHCPDGGLSEAMQRLGAIYTRHVNDRVGRDGPLFRGRFHSRTVESDAHLLAAVRYIHRNALDLPDVDHVERYRWSSHRAYLGHRAAPTWLRTDVVLEHFGNDRSEFATFVDGLDEPSRGSRTASIDVAAFEQIAAFVLAEVGLGEHGKLAALARAATIAVVLDSPGGAPSEAWMQAAFRFPSRAALRTSVSRVRQRVESDLRFAAAVDRTRQLGGSNFTRGLTPGEIALRDQRAARAAS